MKVFWLGRSTVQLFKLAAFASLSLLPLTACAQSLDAPPTKQELMQPSGFSEHVIDVGDTSILFYKTGDAATSSSRLFVYLQGSDPSPQFSYRFTDDGFEPLNWIPRDFERIGENDVYVVIEKPGFEGLFEEPIASVPAEYHDVNSLDDRVNRANAVIDHLTANTDFDAVILYGHSEGAPVAAKLATVNDNITHLGFWAGNALPDLFDFALQSRLDVHRGEATAADAQAGISEMLDYFENYVAANPDDVTVDDFGYTNKRWMSYSEPPLYNLMRLDIPVYVQVATDDESAPIESSVMIPLEFARLGKNNLSYNVCEGCDHGFFVTDEDG